MFHNEKARPWVLLPEEQETISKCEQSTGEQAQRHEGPGELREEGLDSSDAERWRKGSVHREARGEAGPASQERTGRTASKSHAVAGKA